MTTMTTKYVPTFDRILVRRDAAAEKIGSIELPKQAQEELYTGLVLAAGPDCKQIKQGQRITFAVFAGQLMPGESKDHLLMREDDVMAVMVEDAE